MENIVNLLLNEGKELDEIIEKYYQKKNDLISVKKQVIIMLEKQRIDGVLLGLSIAKKAWDKDLGRNEIYENEILYKEELAKLSSIS